MSKRMTAEQAMREACFGGMSDDDAAPMVKHGLGELRELGFVVVDAKAVKRAIDGLLGAADSHDAEAWLRAVARALESDPTE